MGFRVWGLGLGVWGLGFRAWGLGFGAWGLGFRVWGLGFGVWGLGFGVWGLGCKRVRRGPLGCGLPVFRAGTAARLGVHQLGIDRVGLRAMLILGSIQSRHVGSPAMAIPRIHAGPAFLRSLIVPD